MQPCYGMQVSLCFSIEQQILDIQKKVSAQIESKTSVCLEQTFFFSPTNWVALPLRTIRHAWNWFIKIIAPLPPILPPLASNERKIRSQAPRQTHVYTSANRQNMNIKYSRNYPIEPWTLNPEPRFWFRCLTSAPEHPDPKSSSHRKIGKQENKKIRK